MKNNDFLIIKLNQKNEFRTNASFEINEMKFSAVDVKIDTGCPHTSFPMLKLGLSEETAYKLKEQDCQNENVAKTISFGVNDTKTKRDEDKRKFKSKRYMELNSISFKHTAKNFSLGVLPLGDFPISVSYDRTGNTLIGMDILKKLEIFIGKNQKKSNWRNNSNCLPTRNENFSNRSFRIDGCKKIKRIKHKKSPDQPKNRAESGGCPRFHARENA